LMFLGSAKSTSTGQHYRKSCSLEKEWTEDSTRERAGRIMHTTYTKPPDQEIQSRNMEEQQWFHKRMQQYHTTIRAAKTREDWEDGWNRHSKAKEPIFSQSFVDTDQIDWRPHLKQSFGSTVIDLTSFG
jgi:hypothetical protein